MRDRVCKAAGYPVCDWITTTKTKSCGIWSREWWQWMPKNYRTNRWMPLSIDGFDQHGNRVQAKAASHPLEKKGTYLDENYAKNSLSREKDNEQGNIVG